MCGRFALMTPKEEIAARFDLSQQLELAVRYNIAPSQLAAVIRQKPDTRNELIMMRWGLVPHWAKDMKIGYKMINARAETVADKPSFRSAFKQRRCLIPSDGFFEWQHAANKTKQPYFIKMKNGDLFAYAGLWESWQDPESGKTVESFTIITTGANTIVTKIHDRMPVILRPEQYGHWLSPTTEQSFLKNLLGPFDPFKMTAYPVSGMCNNAQNDAPGCIKKVDI